MDTLGTLSTTTDDRLRIELRRELPHSPETVWTALTETGQLRSWFADILDYDAAGLTFTPGAELTFTPRADYAELGTALGTVLRAEPPHVLEYLWGAESLCWTLEPTGGRSTHLTFTNVFDDRDFAAANGAGWHAGLERLADHLAGRDPHNSLLETDEAAWEDLVARYERALG